MATYIHFPSLMNARSTCFQAVDPRCIKILDMPNKADYNASHEREPNHYHTRPGRTAAYYKLREHR